MRTVIYAFTLAAAACGLGLALSGCGSATDSSVGGGMQDPLIGTWVSAGADVAPLLAGPPFNNVMITATFSADGTYSVDGVDTMSKHLAYTGTYQTMSSSVAGIVTIELHQVQPQTATAEGMFQIDTSMTPARMQYEVVQTQPTNGLTPPVPEKGFGSTIYNGKQISTLIQKYTQK
jgi:hypothetical protein